MPPWPADAYLRLVRLGMVGLQLRIADSTCKGDLPLAYIRDISTVANSASAKRDPPAWMLSCIVQAVQSKPDFFCPNKYNRPNKYKSDCVGTALASLWEFAADWWAFDNAPRKKLIQLKSRWSTGRTWPSPPRNEAVIDECNFGDEEINSIFVFHISPVFCHGAIPHFKLHGPCSTVSPAAGGSPKPQKMCIYRRVPNGQKAMRQSPWYFLAVWKGTDMFVTRGRKDCSTWEWGLAQKNWRCYNHGQD